MGFDEDIQKALNALNGMLTPAENKVVTQATTDTTSLDTSVTKAVGVLSDMAALKIELPPVTEKKTTAKAATTTMYTKPLATTAQKKAIMLPAEANALYTALFEQIAAIIALLPSIEKATDYHSWLTSMDLLLNIMEVLKGAGG